MSSPLVKQIPNALTTLRLLLALPIGLLILGQNYAAVLWLALIGGLSDGADGWLARRLDARSRYGAVVDPLSDKVMLDVTYLCLATGGLLPWWVAAIVVSRDAVIVGGALAYHLLIGKYEMAPSLWGKACTFVQIGFALMLVTDQITPVFSLAWIQAGLWALVVLTVFSGGHYAYAWGSRALAHHNKG